MPETSTSAGPSSRWKNRSCCSHARPTAGKTWSKPIEISTREGLPRDDNGAVEGFTGAVAADGTLYVTWCDLSGIVLAVSKDGGRSFSHSRTVVQTAPSYFSPESVSRGNGFPQIGIDPRTRQLFVTWADYTNGDVDVFSATSKDRGKHWSPAVRVNTDALHNGQDQFFQWLAVDPVDGSENIIFCDRRRDPANRSYYMVLARSTDAGQSFKNYAWATPPSDPKDVFMGDYMGIAAHGGKVYGIWARTATPEQLPPDTAKAAEPPKESAADEGGGAKPLPTLKRKGLFIEVGLADFSPAATPR